jgi:hypothetical protein
MVEASEVVAAGGRDPRWAARAAHSVLGHYFRDTGRAARYLGVAPDPQVTIPPPVFIAA